MGKFQCILILNFSFNGGGGGVFLTFIMTYFLNPHVNSFIHDRNNVNVSKVHSTFCLKLIHIFNMILTKINSSSIATWIVKNSIMLMLDIILHLKFIYNLRHYDCDYPNNPLNCAFNYFCLSLFIVIISRLSLFDIVPILALMLFMFLLWCCSYLICSCSNLSHCFGSTLHFDPTSWAFLVLMMFLLLHFCFLKNCSYSHVKFKFKYLSFFCFYFIPTPTSFMFMVDTSHLCFFFLQVQKSRCNLIQIFVGSTYLISSFILLSFSFFDFFCSIYCFVVLFFFFFLCCILFAFCSIWVFVVLLFSLKKLCFALFLFWFCPYVLVFFLFFVYF